MLHEMIKREIDAAFRARDTHRTNLLKTLYAEFQSSARSKENRPATDDEVLRTIRKFIANATILAEAFERAGRDPSIHRLDIEVLGGFLPEEVGVDEVRNSIEELIASGAVTRAPSSTGAVMKFLKDRYGERFDGKTMSPSVKAALSA